MNVGQDEINFDDNYINDPFLDPVKHSEFSSEPYSNNNVEADIVGGFFLDNSITLILASVFVGLFILVFLSWLAKKKVNNKSEIKNTKPLKSFLQSYDPNVDYRKLNEEKEKQLKKKAVKDPIHEFSEGRLENLPFQCPFMEAFKHAKKSQELDESPENIENQNTTSTSDSGKKFPPIMKTDAEEILEKSKISARPEEVKSFYEHIPSHVKQLEQKQLLQKFDESDLRAEQVAREEQLNQIYKLMAEKSDTFGVKSFDDVKDQMRLYVR